MKESVELIRDEVYVFDAETFQMIYMNRAARRKTGISEAEVPNFTPLDIVVDIDEQSLRDRLEPLVSGELDHLIYEREQHRINSVSFQAEIFIQLVSPEGGRPRFVSFIRDVTERKWLLAQSQRLQSSLDKISDEVYMFDAQSLQYFYLNDAALKRTGWKKGTHLNFTPADDDPLFDERAFRRRVAGIVEQGSGEVKFERDWSDGRRAEIRVQFVQPEEEPAHFLVIISDISEREERHEQLLNFRKALSTAHDGIIILNESFDVEFVNNAAAKTIGWQTGAVQNALIKDERKIEFSAIRTALEDLGSRPDFQLLDFQFQSQDRYFEGFVQSMEGYRATRIYLVFIRDVTDLKELDLKKSQFVATVSHELKTPLTSIIATLGLIESPVFGALNERQKNLVSIAQKSADRLLAMISDILDLERVKSSLSKRRFQNVDIAAVIAASMELNQVYGERYQVSLRAEGIDAPIYVLGDQSQLMRVMDNLLSNAAKFSKEGTQVNVNLRSDSSSVWIDVVDTGIGIADADHAMIFEPFSQVDGSDTRRHGGTGLGLNIVQKIVEEHDGKLSVKSHLGEGSTFTVELPRITE